MAFAGWQEEHHTAGHHDVPDAVCVVVVLIRFREDVHRQADDGSGYAGEQIENPALPGGRVALPALHSSVDLGLN